MICDCHNFVIIATAFGESKVQKNIFVFQKYLLAEKDIMSCHIGRHFK